MSLYKFTSGVNTSFSTELNSNHSVALRELGRSLIRQLQDRNIDFSADGGEWAEAYSDSNGRLNSVDTVLTTARLNSDKYTLGIDTIGSSEGSGNFSGGSSNSSITATITVTSNSILDTVRFRSTGGTVTSYNITAKKDGVVIATTTTTGNGSSDASASFSITDYDDYFEPSSTNTITISGSVSTLTGATNSYSGTLYSVPSQLVWGSDSGNTLSLIEVTQDDTENEITHNIPSNTFSSTISSSFGTTLVADWEEGANIQYKLTNATEDTGWLDYNEISTFTAFTSEPTKCIVKLVPKTTSPTSGYPSIKGFAVFE